MTQPTYLSLFTGAGGIDLGLDHAGWTCTGQAEIDDTCRGVLAHHWPNIRRWRDVRDVPYADGHGRRPVDGNDDHQGTDRPSRDPRHPWWHADLIAGGFPCQDVSVAGRRAGLAGERSGLWWEFHRVIHVVRPRAVLVENVEGLLSSNGGRDMGAILDALVDLGYGAAWRVLDAQHFGVPQRRRRVFLLALLGGDSGTRRAAQVLALTPGSTGDPPTGRSEGPGTPARVVGGPRGAFGDTARCLTTNDRYDGDTETFVVANALDRQDGGPDDNSAQANHLTPTAAGVRRLTPRECERLMGWPDDHTRWTADGREVADSRRYAMCGNGVVAPVAQWIGGRLRWQLFADDVYAELNREGVAA